MELVKLRVKIPETMVAEVMIADLDTNLKPISEINQDLKLETKFEIIQDLKLEIKFEIN